MNRSLWAVLAGTFTLRFSTGLTGAMLTFYLARLPEYHGVLDQLLGLGAGVLIGGLAFALIHASFYASELVLSPVFGVLSDRQGHWRVMQYGPLFGIVAVVEGDVERGIDILRAAAAREDSLGKHPVSPGAILPIRELLADVLLGQRRPYEASKEYKAALRIYPRRFNAIYGAAAAAQLDGQKEEARKYYTELLELSKDGDGMRYETKVAQKYLEGP